MIQHSSTFLTEIKIFMGDGLFTGTARIPTFQKDRRWYYSRFPKLW